MAANVKRPDSEKTLDIAYVHIKDEATRASIESDLRDRFKSKKISIYDIYSVCYSLRLTAMHPKWNRETEEINYVIAIPFKVCKDAFRILEYLQQDVGLKPLYTYAPDRWDIDFGT
ncbi:hypothetical protein O9K51_02215 [Purpureocillium lavendulum]|uniref:Uncharacterized protein n=1 Tax=Purpureocillium lavendulum TaxID=1247861 RepID=A0AB34FWW9_9HYPO|nr:hypothetical protein O9K51_02215 [Purpureocillium lavendulum]